MKAKFADRKGQAKRYDGKETIESLQLVATRKGEILTPVRAEWYMGRSSSASVVYCNVWINHGDFNVSGTGSAVGGGYHKKSAAFAEALASAGVELYGSPYSEAGKTEAHGAGTYTSHYKPSQRCHIGGCGDSAVNEAMKAVGQALGFRKSRVI
jgi:hypothetical protein